MDDAVRSADGYLDSSFPLSHIPVCGVIGQAILPSQFFGYPGERLLEILHAVSLLERPPEVCANRRRKRFPRSNATLTVSPFGVVYITAPAPLFSADNCLPSTSPTVLY